MFSKSFLSIPYPLVALPCGSVSMSNTFLPLAANDDDKLIDLSELFKIFGDSTRIKIINILLNKEMCVNEISNAINVSQSAVSHQLRLLKGAKLVKYKKEGKEKEK